MNLKATAQAIGILIIALLLIFLCYLVGTAPISG